MHERTTYRREPVKSKKIHPPKEASNPQGIGSHRQRGGGCPEVSSTSSILVPLEKQLGARNSGFRQWEKNQSRSPLSEAGKEKRKVQGDSCASDLVVDVLKKRDEPDLTNRHKGSIYSKEQHKPRLQVVQRGVRKSQVLKTSGIWRSFYI